MIQFLDPPRKGKSNSLLKPPFLTHSNPTKKQELKELAS